MEDLNQLRPEQESGAKKTAPDDVDALLQDVKSLLGETDADIAAEAPAEPDTEDSEPITADDVLVQTPSIPYVITAQGVEQASEPVRTPGVPARATPLRGRVCGRLFRGPCAIAIRR